jgi:hypothetical protein
MSNEANIISSSASDVEKKQTESSLNKGINKQISSTLSENKEELFKLQALAEALSFPLLFVGVPGTGKTQAVIDYSKAKNLDSPEQKPLKTFVIEVHEDTRPSAIVGNINLEKLVTEKKFEILSHIPDSDVVIINEVDKGQSGFRNSMLSVMNERKLFLGKKEVECNWKLFVATCNNIPKDEIDSPLWDRFMIKYQVPRTNASSIITTAINNLPVNNYTVYVPTMEEIDNVKIPKHKFRKFVETGYSSLSDRTLIKAARLIKAIHLIWGININKALVKAMSLLSDSVDTKKLSNKLISNYLRELTNLFEKVETITDPKRKKEEFQRALETAQKYLQDGNITLEELKELKENITNT